MCLFSVYLLILIKFCPSPSPSPIKVFVIFGLDNGLATHGDKIIRHRIVNIFFHTRTCATNNNETVSAALVSNTEPLQTK